MRDEMVQIKNPKTGHYVKINKSEGLIVGHKSTPYKNVPIISDKRHNNDG